MSKMSIKNACNDSLEIDVIRYFKNNDNKYLVYSLNESVGDGYIKLYASKIVENIAHIIVDEEEWKLIKEIIKNIIKANHEGSELNIIDLDEKELSNITLMDTRIFKLQGNLVNLLSDNKKVIEKEIIAEIEEFEETEEFDYQNLYETEIEKNKELEEKINFLNLEIENYKNKINKIINLIEE